MISSKLFQGNFSMKDLNELDWILGMAIKRDQEKRVMEISQTAYIDMVLNKFGMADCKPVLTPMQGTLTKTNDKEIKPDSEYMKLVGSLLYAALVTRPDIAFAVQSLGKHLQGPNEELISLSFVFVSVPSIGVNTGLQSAIPNLLSTISI
jgi:hypothetical protein